MSMIDPGILKTVRKARKIARSRLAKLSGLTERQITRLETSSASAALPTDALTRLSCALQVPEMALTGDLALIDDDLTPASEHRCTNGCCG
ncbi:MAG: helix-turn-helix transcriptional regulator [Pseudomonadota bacterium]